MSAGESTTPRSSEATPSVASAVPDDLSTSTAPMPTRHTLRMRSSLPVQAARFGVISIKMMRMVLKSHG